MSQGSTCGGGQGSILGWTSLSLTILSSSPSRQVLMIMTKNVRTREIDDFEEDLEVNMIELLSRFILDIGV